MFIYAENVPCLYSRTFYTQWKDSFLCIIYKLTTGDPFMPDRTGPSIRKALAFAWERNIKGNLIFFVVFNVHLYSCCCLRIYCYYYYYLKPLLFVIRNTTSCTFHNVTTIEEERVSISELEFVVYYKEKRVNTGRSAEESKFFGCAVNVKKNRFVSIKRSKFCVQDCNHATESVNSWDWYA